LVAEELNPHDFRPDERQNEIEARVIVGGQTQTHPVRDAAERIDGGDITVVALRVGEDGPPA
jgi:hypothetical protein